MPDPIVLKHQLTTRLEEIAADPEQRSAFHRCLGEGGSHEEVIDFLAGAANLPEDLVGLLRSQWAQGPWAESLDAARAKTREAFELLGPNRSLRSFLVLGAFDGPRIEIVVHPTDTDVFYIPLLPFLPGWALKFKRQADAWYGDALTGQEETIAELKRQLGS